MQLIFEPWQHKFLSAIQNSDIAAALKSASLAEDLRAWTTCLTGAVVESCQKLGWAAAGKGHRCDHLPQPGQEYLGIDVMAFASRESGTEAAWQMPLAAFELENHRTDNRVAYSLWKVLCIRAELRVVFGFRRDWEASRRTVDAIGKVVIGRMSPEERMAISGETYVIIGNRGEGETFPWGYFKCWRLDANIGRFEKI